MSDITFCSSNVTTYALIIKSYSGCLLYVFQNIGIKIVSVRDRHLKEDTNVHICIARHI